MSDAYDQFGYGRERRIGFGEKPGVVVVDFQTAFTEERFPLGRSKLIHAAVEKTATLLDAARKAEAPRASTTGSMTPSFARPVPRFFSRPRWCNI